jgi:hypothetical protein
MDPQSGKIALSSALTILLLSIVILPVLDPNSAEFVPAVLALIISGLFLTVVIFAIRRAAGIPISDQEDDE